MFRCPNLIKFFTISKRSHFCYMPACLISSFEFPLFGKVESSRWMRRQIADPFVKKASLDGYRCRSAYKLIEINKRFGFFKPGKVVIDCGASPGSWTQVAVERVILYKQGIESGGKVIAIDLLDIAPIPGALILENCDFTHTKTREKILNAIPCTGADVVMSDMAPNATGNHEINHEQIMDLCEVAFSFSKQVLSPGGVFLCKVWDGRDTQNFVRELQGYFKNVRRFKPEASRKESSELYLVSSGYNSA